MTTSPAKTKTCILNCLFFVLILLVAGCAPQNKASLTPSATVSPSSTATIGATSEEPSPTPIPSSTSVPLEIFLSESLPVSLGAVALPEGFSVSTDSSAPLWFGPEDDAPEGEILHTAQWVYALAAPFPTLVDAISLDELRAYWQGDPPISLDLLSALYLPEAVSEVFEQQWGLKVGRDIRTFSKPPEVETLWEENAWAVLPFDELDPKLKSSRWPANPLCIKASQQTPTCSP